MPIGHLVNAARQVTLDSAPFEGRMVIASLSFSSSFRGNVWSGDSRVASNYAIGPTMALGGDLLPMDVLISDRAAME